MNTPAKVKVTSIAQLLLIIYCIVNAVLVLKIENDLRQSQNDLQQVQDVLVTVKKQADANSELLLLLAKLRESDKGKWGSDVIPMFPHIKYD